MAVGQGNRSGARARTIVLVVVLATAVGGVGWPALRPAPGGGTTRAGAALEAGAEAAEPEPEAAAGTARSGSGAPGGPATTVPLVGTAAGPAPPPPPVTPPGRDPGRVFVAGDSLTYTAVHPHGVGDGAPADVEFSAGFGWTAADVQPSVDAAVQARPIDTLVVALGTNDSSPGLGGDGWDGADADRIRHLVGTVGDQACVVIVLPGYGPGVLPAHAVEMDEARGDILAIGAERQAAAGHGPTVFVDWQGVLDREPGLATADGIHMVGPSEGVADPHPAALRRGLMWGGVDACAQS